MRTKAGFCTQLYVLSVREYRSTTRAVIGQVIGFVITAFLNLLFGIIFLRAGSRGPTCESRQQCSTDVQTHFGAVTQLAIGAMFGAAQPIMLTFPIERPIFIREYATGSYSVIPYFVS